MDSAYRLANAVCKAGMAPKGLDTPEKAMVAIMHGLEVGLTPMAALQRIAVVNGRPTIWGDGAIGLVRGSGLCEYIKEWIEGNGDARTAYCEAKRRGEPEPIRRSFSVADAKKAGLWGKQGPWQQFSDRMQQMRARGFTLRDGFADVLGGLYLREEIEDAPPQTYAPRASEPPMPPAIEHAPPTAPQLPAPAMDIPVPPQSPRQTASAPSIDYGAVLEAYRTAAMDAQDIEQLDGAWANHISPVESNGLPKDLYEEAAKIDDLRRGMLDM
jgi:hypothetical protein